MGLLACLEGMLDHIAGHGSLYHPAWIHSFDVRKTALKLNLWVALKSHRVGSKIEAGLTTSSHTVLAGLHSGAPPQLPMHGPGQAHLAAFTPQELGAPAVVFKEQLLLLPSWDINRLVQHYLSLYHTRRKNLKHPKNIFENLFWGRAGLLWFTFEGALRQASGHRCQLVIAICHLTPETTTQTLASFSHLKNFPICKTVTRQLSCKDT